ncbi:MAG: RDD family protein [Clostridia bacterium]|nr:RDD family protein [Clostridia bacterium]
MTISIQKANFWKRFSAWLVDTVAVFFVALGVFILACSIVGTDKLEQAYQDTIEPYRIAVEAEFSIDLEFINTEEYRKMEQADRAAYDDLYKTAQEALSKKIEADKDAVALYNEWLTQSITAAIVGLLASHLLLNFCLPLLLKNGQTLGKKTFGLAVMRTNGVKVSGAVLFSRQFIGLCAIETLAVIFMCFLGIVGLITALLVQVLQIGVMIKTETNSSIHDLLADTVVVELASQQIFETEEERAQFLAQESVETQESTENASPDEESAPLQAAELPTNDGNETSADA